MVLNQAVNCILAHTAYHPSVLLGYISTTRLIVQMYSYAEEWHPTLYVGHTLAPPGEYHWTVCLQRRCGLMSNYFDPLLLFIITPNGSTHKIYKSIYKKHTIHNIKRNYKLANTTLPLHPFLTLSTLYWVSTYSSTTNNTWPSSSILYIIAAFSIKS